MSQVILKRGNHTEVFGTYETREEAERQADAHRQAGYYEVTVK